MANVFQYMHDLEGDELAYVNMILEPMTDKQAQQYALIYRARRKDPQMILILTLVGFVVIAGIQRFVLGQIGMGVLYLLTFGLCGIGTIIDLVNHKKMTSEYNMKQAYEVANMMRTMGV
ncbi:MAG: TM2 domain-containing protein [Ignavibacteria bacterium]|nr:TM2 domain-containing protein [Ignavibacteria bacterium]